MEKTTPRFAFRDHQVDALSFLKGTETGIVKAPTGSGKSIIIFEVKVLKDLLKNLLLEGKLELIKGGDNNDSSMMRVPLRELLINKL